MGRCAEHSYAHYVQTKNQTTAGSSSPSSFRSMVPGRISPVQSTASSSSSVAAAASACGGDSVRLRQMRASTAAAAGGSNRANSGSSRRNSSFGQGSNVVAAAYPRAHSIRYCYSLAVFRNTLYVAAANNSFALVKGTGGSGGGDIEFMSTQWKWGKASSPFDVTYLLLHPPHYWTHLLTARETVMCLYANTTYAQTGPFTFFYYFSSPAPPPQDDQQRQDQDRQADCRRGPGLPGLLRSLRVRAALHGLGEPRIGKT